jgi:thiol-disulfide isomerase/thioredoxin
MLKDKIKPALTSRMRVLAGALVFLALAWLVFHQPLNRYLALHLMLRSPSPRDEVFQESAADLPDPTEFLERCWATGKVPQRRLVADFLSKKAAEKPAWMARAHQLVLEGAVDPDMSVRELALAALQSAADPKLLDCVRVQLTDADPLVRQLGLDYLRHLDAPTGVPVAMGLLDDADLRVVAGAEVALMRWTGQDFGVRTHLAIPANPGERQTDPARADKIRQGIVRRREWWQLHAKEFPPAGVASPSVGTGRGSGLPVEDFTLPTLEGNPIHLADFRGKTVILNFWATWCTACVAEMPDLVALQKEFPNRVVILGIALDGMVDEHGHDPAEENEEHAGHPSRQAIRDKVTRIAKARGLNYPVLLDPEAVVGRRFNGGELPTTVIIDAQGVMRRRFIGERSLGVFEAMLKAVTGPAAGR